jgi:DNA-binding SARP family transcriptional activator
LTEACGALLEVGSDTGFVQVTAAAVVEIAPADGRAGSKVTKVKKPSSVRLTLLGGFAIRLGTSPILLAASAQRVVAFIALHERPLRRGHVSGSLWPDVPESRASASLRSALWRIQTRVPLIATCGDQLAIGERVWVDLHVASASAQAVAASKLLDLPEPARSLLSLDLLPGWYDDWVLIERERFRQLRLRALEARCELLAHAGRFGEALEAGLEALATDPLRESAHRALVRVHLAEGNVVEARRQYRLCEELLREELGVAPSAWMRDLVQGAGA